VERRQDSDRAAIVLFKPDGASSTPARSQRAE
jgi:hypothetical protein